jgi:hypothetical protein
VSVIVENPHSAWYNGYSGEGALAAARKNPSTTASSQNAPRREREELAACAYVTSYDARGVGAGNALTSGS